MDVHNTITCGAVASYLETGGVEASPDEIEYGRLGDGADDDGDLAEGDAHMTKGDGNLSAANGDLSLTDSDLADALMDGAEADGDRASGLRDVVKGGEFHSGADVDGAEGAGDRSGAVEVLVLPENLVDHPFSDEDDGGELGDNAGGDHADPERDLPTPYGDEEDCAGDGFDAEWGGAVPFGDGANAEQFAEQADADLRPPSLYLCGAGENGAGPDEIWVGLTAINPFL